MTDIVSRVDRRRGKLSASSKAMDKIRSAYLSSGAPVVIPTAGDNSNRASNSIRFENRRNSAFIPSNTIDHFLFTTGSRAQRSGIASVTFAAFTFALIEKLHAE